jgi:hypothetical protein
LFFFMYSMHRVALRPEYADTDTQADKERKINTQQGAAGGI